MLHFYKKKKKILIPHGCKTHYDYNGFDIFLMDEFS